MTPITLDIHPAIDAPAWGALVLAGPRLWRVRERRGRILGHLRAVAKEAEGPARFRAERFDASRRAFRTVGEFASATEAIESLRE